MISRFISDNIRYKNYTIYAAKSDLKAEVADSHLGWVWWVLEPLCFMLIYTFIFGVVFDAKEDYFPIFVYTGLTAWNFFSKSVKVSTRMVKRNKGIISKVYLPKFILAETTLLVNAFKMIISFVIIAVMMAIFRVPITMHILMVLPMLILLVLITFGCMCVVMHFGVYVTDLANVTDIVLRLLFYMTGIFYSIDKRIGKKYPEISHIMGEANPMAFIVNGLRDAMLYSSRPSLKLTAIWFVLAFGICLWGVWLIYKNENNYVKVI
jgi:ABC-type polysaccharide/polyol phosphate export permease